MNATVDPHSGDVPSTEYRNYKQCLKSCCILQDHYDDERDKTVFYNTTPDLQDQDQERDRIFCSQTGRVLRPTTVSDHITDFLAYSAFPFSTLGQARDIQTDGQTDYGHRCIMSPTYGGGGIIIVSGGSTGETRGAIAPPPRLGPKKNFIARPITHPFANPLLHARMS